ncbi:MAG: DUF2087 domain-containing protein [Hoeflea sp.]|uniref:DUF2087 domain-containing protein n=1 Tax=Hoeflea sp. TaxID=1940281 RepID=UPI001DBF1D2F|nr:DUF2087 domain-containing protein [Hoeflea sp.]MBU4529995.1 DUF2087 domain-containing protein [Alphaproteobacteria bacterium]MBU4543222.1 DUF2087 domain-containing protein [Alphaproteobacteria bacterium]MBU4550238.1 DUF2087 domain-containing protein [Alphaproteobacteria bacterium]MBV1722488.1 DUF2087 domain-containing protein [Hoeflea sp.]MBV1761638.1 DUF2087 domain-containing protein [Hoeflea sp.]
MSKLTIPLVVEDISPFARALARQIADSKDPPSHLTLMNMVSRAAGFRNFQHLRAARMAGERLANLPVAQTIDHLLVERTLNQFDAMGRLRQWPSRRKIQDLCLWPLWAALPARTLMDEREVNRRLREVHLFDDPAILRRTLFSLGMVTRNPDGSDYCRKELAPPTEARALISLLEARRRQGAGISTKPATAGQHTLGAI